MAGPLILLNFNFITDVFFLHLLDFETFSLIPSIFVVTIELLLYSGCGFTVYHERHYDFKVSFPD